MRAPIASPGSLLASLLLASVAACSVGDSMAPPASPPPRVATFTGELVVQIASWDNLPVEVSVTIVGQGLSVSQRSTTVHLNGLAPGGYTIEIALIERDSQVQSGCSIQGASQQSALVVAGTTTSVVFQVSCRLS